MFVQFDPFTLPGVDVDIPALGTLKGEPVLPALIGNVHFGRLHSPTVAPNCAALKMLIELSEHMEGLGEIIDPAAVLLFEVQQKLFGFDDICRLKTPQNASKRQAGLAFKPLCPIIGRSIGPA